MPGLGRQAKTLTPEQEESFLAHVAKHHSYRHFVMSLLSFKAGLRAVEIERLVWRMVLDTNGEIGDGIALTNEASKGGKGGRFIPMSPTGRLRNALKQYAALKKPFLPTDRVFKISSGSVQTFFKRAYLECGLMGCSSHTGRRTFGTRLSRKTHEAGGSLRDVQQLMGHANLNTTMRYLDGDTPAKRKLVELL